MRYLALTFDEEDNEEDWKPLDHTSFNKAIMKPYHAEQDAVQGEAEDVDSAQELNTFLAAIKKK